MLENKTTSFGLHSSSMTVLMSGNNVFRRGGHQRCPTIHNPAQTKSIDTFVKWCVVKINVLVTWAAGFKISGGRGRVDQIEDVSCAIKFFIVFQIQYYVL
jgi:hypothetical protein